MCFGRTSWVRPMAEVSYLTIKHYCWCVFVASQGSYSSQLEGLRDKNNSSVVEKKKTFVGFKLDGRPPDPCKGPQRSLQNGSVGDEGVGGCRWRGGEAGGCIRKFPDIVQQ